MILHKADVIIYNSTTSEILINEKGFHNMLALVHFAHTLCHHTCISLILTGITLQSRWQYISLSPLSYQCDSQCRSHEVEALDVSVRSSCLHNSPLQVYSHSGVRLQEFGNIFVTHRKADAVLCKTVNINH